MSFHVLIILVAYLIIARFTLDLTRGKYRDTLFALINLAAFIGLLQANIPNWVLPTLGYVGFVAFIFLLSRSQSKLNLFTLWLPILVLVVAKFLLPWGNWKPLEWAGISYMMFRLVLVSYEIRSGAVSPPGLFRFLAYCFYLPTALVGPINPFREHVKFENRVKLTTTDVLDAVARIVYGYFQFRVVAPIVNRLSFHGHWSDANEYGIGFFILSCSASFLYLYFNFCGFCDIALGASKILGVPVIENFDRPFAAVNVKDFWNRWHISLSSFMRDLVFNPLSKTLTRAWGSKNVSHAIAATIFVVFVLIGIWHGAGINYLLFGLMHAFGVMWNHYQAIWLKKKLGKKYKYYVADRRVQVASQILTFLFVSVSFFFFENDVQAIQKIWGRLRPFQL